MGIKYDRLNEELESEIRKRYKEIFESKGLEYGISINEQKETATVNFNFLSKKTNGELYLKAVSASFRYKNYWHCTRDWND